MGAVSSTATALRYRYVTKQVVSGPSHEVTQVRRVGTQAGEEALEYYAHLFVEGEKEGGFRGAAKMTGAAVGGFFSALWTKDTANATVHVLSICLPPAAFVLETTTRGGAMIEQVMEFDPPVVEDLEDIKRMALMCEQVYTDNRFGYVGLRSERLSLQELREELFLDDSVVEMFDNRETNAESGFAVGLYRIHGSRHYYLCFRGTENNTKENATADWATNAQQGVGVNALQYKLAMDVANHLKARGVNFVAIGHSLGGGLAASAAAVTGMRGVTFNAAGVHPDTVTLQMYAHAQQQVVNYAVLGEILTTVQEYSIAVPALGKTEYLWPAEIADPITWHLMGAVRDALELL